MPAQAARPHSTAPHSTAPHSAREEPAHAQASPQQAAVALRAALARSGDDTAARLALIDALLAIAAAPTAGTDQAGAALDEAEALFPDDLPPSEEWRMRAFGLHRLRAARAQGVNAHREAVAAFEAALAALPSDIATAGRDANAARLQLLVRLARSRLSLAEGVAAIADMRLAATLVEALRREIPQRPLDMMGASVLGHLAMAQAATGDLAAAAINVAAFFAAIDRLAAPELEPLRQQIARAWAGALTANGRAAEAVAVLAAVEEAGRKLQAQPCGCGHDRGHHHAHAAAGDAHAHAHDESCGCGTHAH